MNTLLDLAVRRHGGIDLWKDVQEIAGVAGDAFASEMGHVRP